MRQKIKLGLILTLLCLTLLGVTACGGGGEEGVSQQLVEVARGDLTISVTGSGKIETSYDSRLTFGSTGKVEKIYVEEGDAVSTGEVLAELDTSALELALTQAQVSLTQAELALTQAELAQYTAEYNLKNTRGTEGALKLALLNKQISLEEAQDDLDTGITAIDYEAAEAALNKARVWYDYVLRNYPDALYAGEQDEELEVDDITGKLWLEVAQDALDVAQANYDNILAGYDSQEVTLLKKQVEAAEMGVAQAQQDLDELAEDIALKELQVESAQQSVAGAERSVKLAQQSLEEAERQLKEATIIAPFDGVVAQVLAKEGDIIPSPSMAPKTVVYLIDPGSMKLVVELDEIDIPSVELNQEAIVTLDALRGAEFMGRISAILPMPKEVGGVTLFDVRVDLDVPESSGIRVGMSASADIVVEERSNVLLVPSRAVKQDSEGRAVVKVISDEQIEERLVVVGVDDGLRTEILSGLREGETVVVEVRVKSTSGMSMF